MILQKAMFRRPVIRFSRPTTTTTTTTTIGRSSRSVQHRFSSLVTDHVASLRREQNALAPFLPAPAGRSPSSYGPALRALEKVLGVPAEDYEDLLMHIPDKYWDTWMKRLLPWQEIRRGRDLFIPGLGSFDILGVYEAVVAPRKVAYSKDFLNVIKAAPLRKALRRIGGTDFENTIDLEDGRSFLAGSTELDLAELMLATGGDFKRRGFCDPYPPFPVFVDTSHHVRDGEFRYVPSINEKLLWQTLCCGGVPLEYNGLTPASSSTPFWLVSISEVHAMGYFQNAILGSDNVNRSTAYGALTTILSMHETCPQRQHLLRHRQYWNNPDTVGSLDEIVRSMHRNSWPDGETCLMPSQVLRRLRAARQGDLGPDISYDFLEALPDSGSIVVLRSKHALAEAAKQLRNCALEYARFVERGEKVLVVLRENGKNKAMGMHPLRDDWSQDGWEQIYEASNRKPSDETLRHFRDYTRILRRWHRDVFVPEQKRERH